MEFQTLKVSVTNHIAHIELNRPDKANAMDMVMWREIGKAFDWADGEADVRVVVVWTDDEMLAAEAADAEPVVCERCGRPVRVRRLVVEYPDVAEVLDES